MIAIDIINEVRRIAAANPDYVYDESEAPQVPGLNRRCFYWKYGRPSCIFGRALYNLGVQGDALIRADGASTGGQGIVSVLMDLGIPATTTESQWMGDVQYAQDRGFTWGKAIAEADVNFPLTPTVASM